MLRLKTLPKRCSKASTEGGRFVSSFVLTNIMKNIKSVEDGEENEPP